MDQRSAISDQRSAMSRFLARFFGFILIVSSAVKVVGYSGGSLADLNQYLRGYTVFLLIAEFMMGCWLLSGFASRASSLIAKFILIAFIIVNLVKAIQGLPSCGCFGDLVVHPWLMVIVESIYLFGMIYFVNRRVWTDWDSHGLSITVFIMLGYASLIAYSYTTNNNALSSLQTNTEQPDISTDIQLDNSVSEVLIEFNWTNITSEPVQLIYMKSSCDCLKCSILPIWVQPNQTIQIPMLFSPTESPGPFQKKFVIATTQSTLRGLVSGHVK